MSDRPRKPTARPQRQPRHPRRGLRRRGQRLPRPGALGRPRLAAGHRRARHHLDGLHSLNPIFLSPNNLVNLLFDCSTIGVISLGIVCVLMLGEIDLSVGSMSGVASALLGVLWVNQGCAGAVAIVAALAARRRASARSTRCCCTRLGDAELRLDALGPARAPRAAALHARRRPARSTCPTARRSSTFGQLMVMPAWLSHGLALIPGVVDARRRPAHHASGAARANLSPGSLGGLVVKALAHHRRARVRRLLPQPRPRRAVDVRPLRRCSSS